MQADETQCNQVAGANVNLLKASKHEPEKYQKVFDARKRRLRGLWERNETFYGQMTVTNPDNGAKTVRRVRLEDKDSQPVTTTPQAVAVLNKMNVQREDDTLKITPKHTHTLSEYGKTYIARLQQLSSAAGNAKRPGTIRLEKTLLKSLGTNLGNRRLREITPGMNGVSKSGSPQVLIIMRRSLFSYQKTQPVT